MPPYCQLAGKKETDVRRAVGVVLVVLCLFRLGWLGWVGLLGWAGLGCVVE